MVSTAILNPKQGRGQDVSLYSFDDWLTKTTQLKDFIKNEQSHTCTITTITTTNTLWKHTTDHITKILLYNTASYSILSCYNMKYFLDYKTTFPIKVFYKNQLTTLDFTFWRRKNLQSGTVPFLKI